MFRVKRLLILLLPAILLAACQLFEPLPTLPPILTLEPLASESAAGLLQASSTPVAGATSPQVSPEAPTQPAATSAASTAALPISSQTSAPTQAPSATSMPTNPPAATATRPAPTSAGPSAWHNVLIMPGAREGAEEDGAYSYVVNASAGEVQDYYEQQMPRAGWTFFASGEGEAGNPYIMFQKDNVTATIGVISQGGSTLVLIVAE